MQDQNSSLTGYILIAVSAVTFSAKGIFAKILYTYGIDPVTLLALRFAIALPFFWGLLFVYQSERVGKRDLIVIILSGLVGFYTGYRNDIGDGRGAGYFLQRKKVQAEEERKWHR